MKSINLRKDFEEYYKDTLFKEELKNTYIKNALKELLYDVVSNYERYLVKNIFLPSRRDLALKEITYILVISIKDFLNQINIEEKTIYSTDHAKSSLTCIIKSNISKLKCNLNNKKNNSDYLEDCLNELYRTHDTVSNDSIIQFIYWSVKNIPRLCINTKKSTLDYEINVILKNYFDIVFLVIEEYKKSNKEMSALYLRNFLSSIFIDKILESKYFQKTFN